MAEQQVNLDKPDNKTNETPADNNATLRAQVKQLQTIQKITVDAVVVFLENHSCLLAVVFYYGSHTKFSTGSGNPFFFKSGVRSSRNYYTLCCCGYGRGKNPAGEYRQTLYL